VHAFLNYFTSMLISLNPLCRDRGDFASLAGPIGLVEYSRRVSNNPFCYSYDLVLGTLLVMRRDSEIEYIRQASCRSSAANTFVLHGSPSTDEAKA
jgi:hypothetical protein